MRDMKNSEVGWIGQIPQEWYVHRNKTHFDCSKSIVGANSSTMQLLSLTTKGIVKKRQDALSGKVPESFDTYQSVSPNDIVMCLFDLDCSAVFSGISPFYGMISPAYKVLQCANGMVPQYADYWFSFVFNGRKFAHYSKNLRFTLTYEEFAALPIVVPPVNEQQRIADFLDSKCVEIDNIINKTESSIEEYKRLKQSIITEAVTKGIRGERKMKDSEIEWVGEIPEEWIETKLKYETICNANSLGEQTDSDYEFDYIDIGSVEYGIGITHIERSKFCLAPSRARRIVNKNDVIVSTVRTYLKAMAIIGNINFPTVVSTGFAVLSCQKSMSANYLYYYLQSVPFIEYVTTHSNGIGYPSINSSDLITGAILKPSIKEQNEIASYLDHKCSEIDSLIESKKKFILDLESYKKSLIYEYVTGKKEVEQ